MTDATRPPARVPCVSCPYRRDVPSGVWHPEEYAKLPAYDEPTWNQPTGLFLCHQQDGRVCAGWAGCHDMDQALAVRLAAGRLAPDVMLDLLDYTTPVPLWESGQAAAEHGMTDVDHPDDAARQTINRLIEKESRRG